MSFVNNENIPRDFYIPADIDDYIYGKVYTMIIRGAKVFTSEQVNLLVYTSDSQFKRYLSRLDNYRHFRLKDVPENCFRNYFTLQLASKDAFMEKFASTWDPKEIVTVINFSAERN